VIGAKTLGILTLLGAVVAASFALGSFAPERLATRGFAMLLFVGCFGVVVGTIVFRFSRLGERSRHYFRFTSESFAWDVSEAHFLGGARRRIVIGENRDGEAFDLPPAVRHALSIALASAIALAAIGSRALEQLGGAYGAMLGATSSLYCPEEEPKKPKVLDPNEPGCELVRRAYALGYAKSLGQCAPKKDDRAESARPMCTRRQRDEPLVHYSWRLLVGFWSKLHATTRFAYVTQARDEFRGRIAHLSSLGIAERQILASAPHASHHIWTNLPDPGDGAFEETTCTNRYLRLPHRPSPPPGTRQASKVFEHVLAQLVFEGTYDNPAGHCREYHVHWGAPLDACKSLSASPESYLTAAGVMADVRQTLDRYRVAVDLASLGGPAPPVAPASIVTFRCYFEGGTALERTSAPVALAGRAFTADQLVVPPSPADATLYVDRYDAVAKLLVNGFHYGRLFSEAAIDTAAGSPDADGMPGATGAAAGLEASFVAPDFLLTRLYELENIDIYLDPSWLLRRPDLLEVYPYERHLKNYVQVFRRQYRRQAGRL
jgi:hypothetical protein